MFVSILVVNHNSGKRLKRCLTCIAAQTYINFEVIIFDSASEDGSENTALPDQRFRLLQSPENFGFAGGNNYAAKLAKGEWLALVNPDTYAEPEWLMTAMAAAKRHSGCAAFGSTEINDENPDILDGCGHGYNFAGFSWRTANGWKIEDMPDEGPLFAPCAAAALYRADAFKQAGGFDEKFFCHLGDIDLAFRLRLMGYESVHVAEAMVRRAASVVSDFSVFQTTRNRIWIFVKNVPDILFWPLLPFHVLGNVLMLFHLPTAALRWGGMVAAIKDWRNLWQRRKTAQKTRTASSWQIARALSWSLRKTFWRM